MANENDKERNLALADGDNTQSKEDTKNEQELEFKIELKKYKILKKRNLIQEEYLVFKILKKMYFNVLLVKINK